MLRLIRHPSFFPTAVLVLLMLVVGVVNLVANIPDSSLHMLFAFTAMWIGMIGGIWLGDDLRRHLPSTPTGALVCVTLGVVIISSIFFLIPRPTVVACIGYCAGFLLCFISARWPRRSVQSETQCSARPHTTVANIDPVTDQAVVRVREFARVWRWQRDRQRIADVQDGVDTACALSIEDLEMVLKRAGFEVEAITS